METQTETCPQASRLTEIVPGNKINWVDVSPDNVVIIRNGKRELVHRVLPCNSTYVCSVSRSKRGILEHTYELASGVLKYLCSTEVDSRFERYDKLNDILDKLNWEE